MSEQAKTWLGIAAVLVVMCIALVIIDIAIPMTHGMTTQRGE